MIWRFAVAGADRGETGRGNRGRTTIKAGKLAPPTPSWRSGPSLSREGVWPLSRLMVDPQDVEGAPNDAVRDDVGGAGDNQLTGAGDPPRPPDLGCCLESQNAGTNTLLEDAGGLGILGKDAQIDVTQVAARLGRPLCLQSATPWRVSRASISAITSS